MLNERTGMPRLETSVPRSDFATDVKSEKGMP